ncbi:hypothetical protein [Azospirillum argentinense]|uniref:hypothetical protein n=1 Tax=Azospirillum argentinense TaxID=2970906 RepID=UPI0032DFA321
MHLTFVAEERESWVGLRPAHMPFFDPVGGMGAAHDLMEHGRRDNGSIEAEMMAFGAMIHVRADAGWWCERRTVNTDPAWHMGGEFPEIWERDHDLLVPEPPPTRRAEDWVENLIDRCWREARRSTAERMLELLEETEEAEAWEAVDRMLGSTPDRFLGWMRLGYRRARRRYCGVDPSALMHTFNAVAAEVDKLVRTEDLVPGERYRVFAFPERCESAITRLSEPY